MVRPGLRTRASALNAPLAWQPIRLWSSVRRDGEANRRAGRAAVKFFEYYGPIYQIKIWDDLELISDTSWDLRVNEEIDLNKFLIYYGCPQYRGVILTWDA